MEQESQSEGSLHGLFHLCVLWDLGLKFWWYFSVVGFLRPSSQARDGIGERLQLRIQGRAGDRKVAAKLHSLLRLDDSRAQTGESSASQRRRVRADHASRAATRYGCCDEQRQQNCERENHVDPEKQRRRRLLTKIPSKQ